MNNIVFSVHAYGIPGADREEDFERYVETIDEALILFEQRIDLSLCESVFIGVAEIKSNVTELALLNRSGWAATTITIKQWEKDRDGRT